MSEVNELSGVDKFIVERLKADSTLMGYINNGNEIQTVSRGSHTSGTLTLAFKAQITIAIPFNAAAATLQTDLENLSTIGVGNVLVTGSAGGPWSVEYIGTLANTNVPQLVMVSSLAGGSGQKVTTVTEGGPRIYSELAPQGATLPCVVFNLQSARDRIAFGARSRIFTRPIYQIKAMTQGESLVSAGQIADRIEAVMLGAAGQLTDPPINIMGTYRLSPYRHVEIFEGVRINHVGGLYKFFVHKV